MSVRVVGSRMEELERLLSLVDILQSLSDDALRCVTGYHPEKRIAA